MKGLRKSFDLIEERAPLHRNITPEDVGGTAVYLASDLSKNVTGEIMFVDSGMSSIGL